MDVNQAYQILSDYQLFSKNENGLARVFEIQEIYERYKPYLSTSTSPLTKRISEVLGACSIIEKYFQLENERVQNFRESLGNDKFDNQYKQFIDERDKEIVVNVGRPLPRCPEIDNHPVILRIYEKHKARTITQKSNALEKEIGSKPGQVEIHAIGNWREPKWKLKQFKLRMLAYDYLIEKNLINTQNT